VLGETGRRRPDRGKRKNALTAGIEFTPSEEPSCIRIVIINMGGVGLDNSHPATGRIRHLKFKRKCSAGSVDRLDWVGKIFFHVNPFGPQGNISNVSTCPELGVASQGKNHKEAYAMLAEAVELWLEAASAKEIQRRLRTGGRVQPLELANA